MFPLFHSHLAPSRAALPAAPRRSPVGVPRRTASREPDKIAMLQGTLGNHAMRRLLAGRSDGDQARDELRQSCGVSGVSGAAGLRDGIGIGADSENLTDELDGGTAGAPKTDAGSGSLDGGSLPGGIPEAKDAGPPAVKVAETVTSAVFGNVNAATTPAGVVDRIPPRIDQHIPVALTGSGSAEISVAGASATNGTATVDGAATKTLSASGAVDLRGITQTAPGAAGNLQLVAKVAGTIVGRSNLFTICAIPTTVTVSLANAITGTARGIAMTTSNNSDSGVVGDLDKVQMSEKVQYTGGVGCFAGITSGNNSGFLPANNSPHGTDSHSVPVSLLTSAGSIDSGQVFVFNDARSGAAAAIVKNSGFNIHREVTPFGPAFLITTRKAGVAMTVRGSTASPGVGGASQTQVV